MNGQIDKLFGTLALYIILILVGTFARFIADSEVLSRTCDVLVFIGSMLSLKAVSKVLDFSKDANK